MILAAIAAVAVLSAGNFAIIADTARRRAAAERERAYAAQRTASYFHEMAETAQKAVNDHYADMARRFRGLSTPLQSAAQVRHVSEDYYAVRIQLKTDPSNWRTINTTLLRPGEARHIAETIADDLIHSVRPDVVQRVHACLAHAIEAA